MNVHLQTTAEGPSLKITSDLRKPLRGGSAMAMTSPVSSAIMDGRTPSALPHTNVALLTPDSDQKVKETHSLTLTYQRANNYKIFYLLAVVSFRP